MLDDLDFVGAEFALDIADDRIQAILDIRALDDHGERVDARGNMLDAHAIALENRERLAQVADLIGHMVGADMDGDEVALARDARDDGLCQTRLGLLADHGAGVVRTVGVLDDQRDARLLDGEDRLFVQDARTHV